MQLPQTQRRRRPRSSLPPKVPPCANWR